MTTRIRGAAALVMALLFWVTPAAAQQTSTTEKKKEKPAATAATFIPPPTVLKDPDPELSPACQALLKSIRELDARIPKSFQVLPRSVADIAKDMDECARLCDQFLSECPGRQSDLYVGRLLARMLLGGSARYRKDSVDELTAQGMGQEAAVELANAQVQERLDKARMLGSAALTASDPDTAEHLLALLLLIDVDTQGGDVNDIREHAESLERHYPTYPLIGQQLFKVGKAYIHAGKYAEAVTYMDGVIEQRGNDPWYPIFNINLFDALQGTGNLKRMNDLMQHIQKTYQALIPQLVGVPRTQAKQWYDVSGFWLGFTQYSLGNVPAALEYFTKNEQYLTDKIATAKAKKRPVDPVIEVYLNFRTKDYIDVLQEFQGKVPATELELGDAWATDNRLSLREAREQNKVVVGVFRMPGNDRSESFYQEMDSFVQEREKDGLTGFTLGYLVGRRNERTEARDAEEIFKMQEEMARLGISLPGGYDPDRKSHKIFHGLHATVGPSTTFVVLNRKGEFAWYLFDPRPMDVDLAKVVVDRILRE